jgi:hypothetical protein
MKKRLPIAMVLPLVIIGCCVGPIASSILEIYLETSYNGWVLLKSPPQNISKLQAADFYTVYAETIDGKLISCRYSSIYNNDCWNEISNIPNIKETDKCYDLPAPPPEIHSAGRIDFGACIPFAGEESTSFSSYILSDNGQVYRLSTGDPALITIFFRSILIKLLCSSIIIAIGLIVASKIMVLVNKINTSATQSG